MLQVVRGGEAGREQGDLRTYRFGQKMKRFCGLPRDRKNAIKEASMSNISALSTKTVMQKSTLGDL